jgi:hypothetical protein
MLYGANGQIIGGQGRRGNQIDAMGVCDGVVICASESRKIHERAKNDSVFRERLEAADRESYALRMRVWKEDGMVGPEPKFEESEHLAMLRHGNKVPDAVWKNQEFGEKVLRSRIENEKLEGSAAGYAGISN